MDYQGILTTTAQSLTGYVVDPIHDGSIIPGRFLSRTTAWDQGKFYQQPIQTEEHDQGGDFVGMPVFEVSAQNTDQNLQWTSKGKRESIVMPWTELAINKTKAGVISLMARKMDVAKNALRDKLATTLTGQGLGDAIEGFDLMTDDSALSSSYGGLSRTTYGSVINGQSNTMTTMSLSALSTQLDLTTPANSQEGTTLMLGTKTEYGYLEQLLDPRSRQMYENVPVYVSAFTPNGGAVKAAELGGASGFTAIFHRGIPYVKEEKVASGVTYFLNENAMDFVSLALPNMKSVTLNNEVTQGVLKGQPSPSAFQMTETMNPYNQLGDIGHIIVYGNFINRKPKRSGVTTGTTGI